MKMADIQRSPRELGPDATVIDRNDYRPCLHVGTDHPEMNASEGRVIPLAKIGLVRGNGMRRSYSSQWTTTPTDVDGNHSVRFGIMLMVQAVNCSPARSLTIRLQRV
jgi:hypothetical protein